MALPNPTRQHNEALAPPLEPAIIMMLGARFNMTRRHDCVNSFSAACSYTAAKGGPPARQNTMVLIRAQAAFAWAMDNWRFPVANALGYYLIVPAPPQPPNPPPNNPPDQPRIQPGPPRNPPGNQALDDPEDEEPAPPPNRPPPPPPPPQPNANQQVAPDARRIVARAERAAQAEALMLEWNNIANDIPFDDNRLHLLLVAVYQPLDPIHFEALALLRKRSAPAPAPTPRILAPAHPASAAAPLGKAPHATLAHPQTPKAKSPFESLPRQNVGFDHC
ncbi:hypothetical protein HDU77_007765 [Chytriomyces hyalinus]|nr:hypothetical protein HDU77_007765 [Chytriomyces hyalinus]